MAVVMVTLSGGGYLLVVVVVCPGLRLKAHFRKGYCPRS